MKKEPRQHVARYLMQDGDLHTQKFEGGDLKAYSVDDGDWVSAEDPYPENASAEGRYVVEWTGAKKASIDDTAKKAEAMLREMAVKPELTEAQARKAIPLATGCLDYFPDALKAVAALSRVGNEQHNPGQPLHWDRSKSGDEADALLRHLVERGTIDTDGVRHSAKVAWRALALLQKEIESDDHKY